MLGVGSDPMLKKQIIGVFGLDSLCITSRSVITGSAYFAPKEDAIYFLDCDNVLSMHQALQTYYFTGLQMHVNRIYKLLFISYS